MGAGIVIRDIHAEEILKRIFKVEGKDYITAKTFASLVGPRDFFTTKVNRESILGTNWRGYVSEKDARHSVKFYLNRQMESKGYGWILETDILKNKQVLNMHKIYIPKAGGSGNDPIVLGKPIYGEPGSVCSVTYLVIGYRILSI